MFSVTRINKGKTLSAEEAERLLDDWVKNPRLKLHMKQVAHLMFTWAVEKESLDGDEAWQWQLAGLLHDADWDQWPKRIVRRSLKNWKAGTWIPRSYMQSLLMARLILV
jgi:predicted hydrolase (HD superfamily)